FNMVDPSIKYWNDEKSHLDDRKSRCWDYTMLTGKTAPVCFLCSRDWYKRRNDTVLELDVSTFVY
ncbi:hypothetical protein, partial [Wolbachia endosymbiont of Mansonella perstans]|uniref:hypothetical protein n=1 Tax=Wolbachia endosymbiont of Mansonella perstans TaxID=229526 RepID=UPI001CE17ACC